MNKKSKLIFLLSFTIVIFSIYSSQAEESLTFSKLENKESFLKVSEAENKESMRSS